MRPYQELPCGGGVADSGGFAQAEDFSDLKWVAATGQCFVELAVDTQPLQSGGQAAQDAVDPWIADWAETAARFRC